jgi:hypothetical protein
MLTPSTHRGRPSESIQKASSIPVARVEQRAERPSEILSISHPRPRNHAAASADRRVPGEMDAVRDGATVSADCRPKTLRKRWPLWSGHRFRRFTLVGQNMLHDEGPSRRSITHPQLESADALIGGEENPTRGRVERVQSRRTVTKVASTPCSPFRSRPLLALFLTSACSWPSTTRWHVGGNGSGQGHRSRQWREQCSQSDATGLLRMAPVFASSYQWNEALFFERRRGSRRLVDTTRPGLTA